MTKAQGNGQAEGGASSRAAVNIGSIRGSAAAALLLFGYIGGFAHYAVSLALFRACSH